MNSRDRAIELATLFAKCPTDLRDWAEAAGYENLKGRIASGAALSSQAATLLALLLAGFGGALSFAVKLLEAPVAAVAPPALPLPLAAAVLCLLFAILAALLTLQCLAIADAPPLYNAPATLLASGGELEQVRCGELANLQLRIEAQTRLNLRRSQWLNAIRLAAVVSPAIAAAIAWYFR